MGTKRNGRFYREALKRVRLRAEAKATGVPDDLLVEECRNSAEVLQPQVLVVERELQDLCYFEYAYLTPNQRDELFIKALNDAAKQLWSEHHARGSGVASELKYNWVDPVLELNTPEIRSAIRSARQHYDAMGFQYYPAIMWVGNAHIAYAGAYGIPRPNQLYSRSAMSLLKVNERWIRERSEPFSNGDIDPRFLAGNFVGHSAQTKALDEIQKYVENSKWPAYDLAKYLREGAISRNEASRRFGASLLERAIEQAGSVRFMETGGSVQNALDFGHPACLGLSYEPTSTVCQKCHFQARCSGVSNRVRARQLEIFGCEDPRKLRQREDAARRQRSSRNRRSPDAKRMAEIIRTEIMKIIGLKKEG